MDDQPVYIATCTCLSCKKEVSTELDESRGSFKFRCQHCDDRWEMLQDEVSDVVIG